MRSALALFLLFLLVPAIPTSALVAEPTPNLASFYFDRDASQDFVFPGSPAVVTLYYIVTNPTPSAIDAYEFTMRIGFSPGLEGSFYMAGSLIADGQAQGIDTGDKSNPLAPVYLVGLATPIPCQPATILHSWQFFIEGNFAVLFYLGPADPPSLPGSLPVIQEAGGDLMYVSTRVPEEYYVACINEPGPDPVEPTTFGTLKALYR